MENIVVIGGGLMGSSAAWQLSNYGEKVLLLERQDKKYREGSSAGVSRITRSLGPKKDIFSFIQRRTVEETKQLLTFLNGLEKTKRHKMSDIYSTTPVTYLYPKSQYQDVKKLKYKGQKDKFKKASGDKAFRILGLTLPDSYIGVKEYKKYSGTLNPKKLIKKLHLGIKKKGNKIRYHQEVTRIIKKGNHYQINIKNTNTGKKTTLLSQKVVVAAGPYTTPLLKHQAPYFKKLIMPKKVVLTYFKICKKRYKTYTKKQKQLLKNAHPLFDQNGQMYFSMLDKIDKDGLPIFKMGAHANRRNIPDLDAVWQQKPRKKEIKWNRKKFVRYLRMLELPIRKKDIQLHRGSACVYTCSKTTIPYVTNILTKDGTVDQDIVVITGMSGTGAKGCLTYGLLAADLLLNTGESSAIYQKTKKKLGVTRLQKELPRFLFKW